MKKADIGLIGLAVMGRNLALNMERNGFTVAVYNRETDWVKDFIEKEGEGKNLLPAFSLKELVLQLSKPRKIMLMIRAGTPVDDVIEELIPLLEKGDIIIDGGNSHFKDTKRRAENLEQQGLLFVGTGVSGGEEGALHGPSIMPGGSFEAWEHVKPILQAISAKAEDGLPCCDWIGPGGAGHFVKMVHNGIEYGDMQLISEAYLMMRDGLGMSNDEMHEVFSQWNKTELDSYLIKITGDILGYKDEKGLDVIDQILDSAGQKGTGKWTVISALEEDVPLTLIGEATFARFISALKKERNEAERRYHKTAAKIPIEDKKSWIENIRQGLFASKIISYAQGFDLLKVMSVKYSWDLNYGNIAMLWREGCIIRSRFLQDIYNAYYENTNLTNLIVSPYFMEQINMILPAWRKTVSGGALYGIPLPAMSSALSYFDGYTTAVSGANMIQAQRDYFGAHTYQRRDEQDGGFYHTNWTGEGGDITSTTYKA